MHGMHLNGCLYSGLCAARSALFSVVTIRRYLKLSKHPWFHDTWKVYTTDIHFCLNIKIYGAFAFAKI